MEWFGNLVVEVVIGLSDLLREEHTPGVVSAGLVGWLVYSSAHFGIKTWQRRRAIQALKDLVTKTATDPADFNDSIDDVTREVRQSDTGRPSSPKALVRAAWDEYRETFVIYRDSNREILRNSVRPSQFFNSEDLHFGPGFWRVQPGLFVTIGLFLTFLGLISALHAMNATEGVSEKAMTNLLSVASAKFIMSLTGLLCSILFTVCLRIGTGTVERAIHSLNRKLEQRLSFLSLEKLAVEQVEATREQKAHFQRIGMELVEELGRPLREELPRTISDSISNAVSPLIAQVGELGTESVTEMVRDLSSRITDDVNDALRQASEQLGKAGDRLDALVDRMDEVTRRMGSEMDGASKRLGNAVRDIRAATEEGVTAARERLDRTGSEVALALEGTGRGIAEIAGEATARAGRDLLGPMGEIAERMQEMVVSLASGVHEMHRASEGIKDGANASSGASENFRSAAGTLVAASDAVKPTVERLESATQDLAASARQVGESARNNAVSAERVLAAAQTALGAERLSIENTLEGLGQVLEGTRGQGDRLDDIDEKLGRAFENYREQVANAVGALHDHVREMQEQLTPALDTMREIVEQAERFVPEQPFGGIIR